MSNIEKRKMLVVEIDGKKVGIPLMCVESNNSDVDFYALIESHDGNSDAHAGLFDTKADTDMVYSKTEADSRYATLAQGLLAESALQEETDPTVPPWAKAAQKPLYTALEVGAAAENHSHPGYAGSSHSHVIGDLPSVVQYVSQTLTSAQQEQARENIGAGTSSLIIGTGATNAAAGNHTHAAQTTITGAAWTTAFTPTNYAATQPPTAPSSRTGVNHFGMLYAYAEWLDVNKADTDHSHTWSEVTGTPTIPAAANNGTLTIQRHGVSAGTFTANQSSSTTINIAAPTWSEVTSKPTTFTPAAHNHDAGTITTGILAIARMPTGTTSTTVALGNHTHAAQTTITGAAWTTAFTPTNYTATQPSTTPASRTGAEHFAYLYAYAEWLDTNKSGTSHTHSTITGAAWTTAASITPATATEPTTSSVTLTGAGHLAGLYGKMNWLNANKQDQCWVGTQAQYDVATGIANDTIIMIRDT